MMQQPNLPALSLRISVTDRCQLRCGYCMPEEGISCHPREDILSFEEISGMVEMLQTAYQIDKIRLTGGEPLLRKHIVELVEMLSSLGSHDLALTTNGQMLAELAAPLKAAGLQRINISLDTLNPEKYRAMTRGGELERTLQGIDAAIAAELQPIKLNAVILRSINDDQIAALLDRAMIKGYEQRFLEIMPIGHGAEIYKNDFVSAAAIMEIIRESYTAELIGRTDGSSAIRYRITAPDGRQGSVGIIAPCSTPFCADCRRLRITPDGMLVGCLARGRPLPIRELLKNRDEFLKTVSNVLGEKRTDASFAQPKIMATIGG
jgi:cyclic pyranopterin phosphate synthase